MIIRTKERDKTPHILNLPANSSVGLIDIQDVSDETIFVHRENVEEIMKAAYELREHGDNGFTQDREMRQIGLIPTTVFLNHPEFANNPELIKKWLNSEEGQPFRTVRGRV